MKDSKLILLVSSGLLLLISIVVGVIGVVWFYSPPGFLATRNTKYAPGYSGNGFREITLGMTKEQVVQIIGEPLAVHSGYYECFVYSKGSGSNNPIISSLGWISVNVCFDEHQQARAIGRNVFAN